MTLGGVLLLVAAAGALLVLGSLLVRTWRADRDRRRRDAVERLRPVALELVDTDGAVVPPFTRFEEQVFVELVLHYSQQVRGEADDRIGAYFERTGEVDRQRRRIRSRWEQARVHAAYRLGDLASARAVPDLLGALEDRSPDVRAAAVRSLGRLSAAEAVEALIAASVGGRVPMAVVSASLLEIGPSAVPNLVALLTHPDPGFRANAVELVGLLGSASTEAAELPALVPVLLRDMSAEVRGAAAGALGRLGAGAGEDALIELLQDRVPYVRSAAARSLGQVGGRAAAEALLEVARRDAFEPAAAAARALCEVDPALVLATADEPGAGPHLREAADRLAL